MTPLTHASGRLRTLGFLIALLLLTTGCVANGGFTRIGSPPYDRGSGTPATEHRTLAAFHAIDAAQAIHVVVVTGPSDEATVRFDDNLLGHVETVVENGTLHIRMAGNVETQLTPQVDVIAAAGLDRIAADSAASVEARDLVVDALAVHATSAGTVRLTGQAAKLDLSLDTAAVAELGELAVTDASVRLATASRATIRAAGSVSGSCLVASSLELVGSPRTQTVSADATSTIHGH
jgi:putative autotransporter adhesin-like protein